MVYDEPVTLNVAVFTEVFACITFAHAVPAIDADPPIVVVPPIVAVVVTLNVEVFVLLFAIKL